VVEKVVRKESVVVSEVESAVVEAEDAVDSKENLESQPSSYDE
jgi:hypothetical protein